MEPLTLDVSVLFPLTDDNLLRLCGGNPNLRIERTADGELEIMSPTGGRTGTYNARILTALGRWNEEHGQGFVFDSSTGFKLNNGAVRSPDAAWMARDRWDGLPEDDKDRFPPLCPDFVLELRSKGDVLRRVYEKMEEWIANGARLAWLIDPEEGNATVYRPGRPEEVVPFDGVLSGEDVLPGFTLEPARLR